MLLDSKSLTATVNNPSDYNNYESAEANLNNVDLKEMDKSSFGSFVSASYHNLLTEYSAGSWGYATISILAQSCYASLAAMLLLKNTIDWSRPVQMVVLFLITILCLGFNASVLAQQKAKYQFLMLMLSVGVSTAVILLNLFL